MMTARYSFCIENDGFCIENDEFCIENDGFCMMTASVTTNKQGQGACLHQE